MWLRENVVEGISSQRERLRTSCPICLEYFRDPVSIHCGHNFCRDCITRSWEWCTGDFCCPQCKETAAERILYPNRELARMLEIARRLSLQAAHRDAAGQEGCKKHREPLSIYCKDDEAFICLICRESRLHRAHVMLPVQDAVQEYKVKALFKTQEENVTILTKEISHLDAIIQEMEEKCQQPASNFLQVRSVTLDPSTAHPQLAVSADGSSVRWEEAQRDAANEEFGTDPFVLGHEGITSGRCCWEVEVTPKGSWAVGVAKESLKRREESGASPEVELWSMGFCEGQFWALSSFERMTLSQIQVPKRVRVTLDYESGQVAFFDADKRALIFIFPSASFKGESIHPWFLVWGEGSQITLCP
uniref:Uncharacterized protein n=1 Tax=Meleagris gallopavo TaxID=9103 RepID=A0A803Y833_MELGA